ncbi:sigma factor-like helix-turn-helix DNA-binding protein [Kitasatospora sp. NPDC085895]|uniref:sigma-70 region 4 domain-containing protein n=1 Tax=Kitasatospora sp. NPDC085895 TaxID=3155057 RepID=UPI00344CC19B
MEQHIGLFSTIATLPERQFDAIVLTYVVGCSTRDTAGMMGVATATVHSPHRDARRVQWSCAREQLIGHGAAAWVDGGDGSEMFRGHAVLLHLWTGCGWQGYKRGTRRKAGPGVLRGSRSFDAHLHVRLRRIRTLSFEVNC